MKTKYYVVPEEYYSILLNMVNTNQPWQTGKKNFLIMKSALHRLNEEDADYSHFNAYAPEKYDVAFICYKVVSKMGHTNFKSNSRLVRFCAWSDDVGLFKYVRLGQDYKAIKEITFRPAELTAFENWKNNNVVDYAIWERLHSFSNDFVKNVSETIEMGIVPSANAWNKVMESLKESMTDLPEFVEDTVVVLKNVSANLKETEFYINGRLMSSYHIVFRGKVDGYKNRASIKVTTNAVDKFLKNKKVEIISTLGNFSEEYFKGKSMILSGKFSNYNGCVVGKRASIQSVD